MTEPVKELTLQLPESFVEALGGLEKAPGEITRTVVLDLVRNGRISAGKGAELLHMDRHGFLDLMAAHEVPAVDYAPESLAYELEGIRKLLNETPRA